MPQPNDSVNSYMQQFLDHNGAHMSEMVSLLNRVQKEFRDLKTSHGILSAVLSAYKTMDDIMAETIGDIKQQISCFGCTAAHCCHQTVAMCEAEATAIAYYCSENNIPISRKYLKKQLAHSKEQLKLKSCSACVFLKDNRCSIYPVRPASCRLHYTTEQIEYCNVKKHRDRKFVTPYSPAALIVQVAMAAEGGKTGRMPQLLLKYSK